MSFTSIQSVMPADLKGKKVLVRCDFNVPLASDGFVVDDLRIRKTLPTIEYLKNAGAKVILISHIENKDGFGLEPIAQHLVDAYSSVFGEALSEGSPASETFLFIEHFLTEETAARIEEMNEGDIILFENLRVNEGEKKNDVSFAEELKRVTGAEIYINDAFAVSHRAHASVVALPGLFDAGVRFAGIQLMSELQHLKIAFNPPRPFVFILGGAKFETKLPLIQKFSTGEKAADYIFLGGALLNDVLKAKGYNVGKSLTSSGTIDLSEVIKNPKLIIPEDVIVQEALPATGDSSIMADANAPVRLKKINEIEGNDIIMDVGPSMVDKLREVLSDSKFVLWNGPMGNYEKGFKDQTIEMAKIVASQSNAGVGAVLGGGDTTATVAELGFEDDHASETSEDKVLYPNMFVSTGGGAMLEYLFNESLPGVEALS